jgi:signal transduction histidine kinase
LQRALRGEEFSAPVEIGPIALETWYSPTLDRDGAVCGYTGVAVNVTKQRRLERQILEISDREQARLGQEIHDGLCQQLVSLAFDANALAAELAVKEVPAARVAVRISDLLDRAITEARQLARGLFPIRLDAQGLPSALEELARATQDRFGVACEFESTKTAPLASKTMATHLYRIAQEAVTNAVKHGKPRSIKLRLEDSSGQLLLRVEDDGQGMVPEKLHENRGMGLHIMDYRARSIGGSFSFAAGANGGINICCSVPGRQR